MCRDRAGRLRCVLAEVNNTFSETHLYVLDKAEQSKADDLYVFRAAKEFHVSPFYGMDWKYVFRVKDTGKKLAIDIDMVRDAKAEFHARLEGEAAPFGAHELRTTLFRFPFTALLSFPRILAQAAKLYFGKKLPVYQKPAPHSRWTIKTAPATLCQRAAGRVIKKLLQRIETGYLSVELPDQRIWKFGLEGTSPQVRLKIRDYCFFSAVLWDADIGLGESYAAGAWDADDLTALLELGVLNSKLYYSALLNSRLLILGSTLLHRLRRNTVHGSRRNIAAHYDLSNAFFQTFLDEELNYSCAIFRNAEESLIDAQHRKIDLLLEKVQLKSGDHLLEIGSGWGSLAIRAAQNYDCRVTSVTVSRAQYEMAAQRVREAGLSKRVNIELCDYREIKGSFDKIVSVEMLEAVGRENLGKFFRICDRVLKPDGIMALQVITIPDQRYAAYSRRCDWIQKHIFPGGHLPSMEVLARVIAAHSSFVIEHVENIGIHYAETLRCWRSRFLANADKLPELGFDREFMRKWLYYFAYCEAGFESRVIGNHQLVLSRALNKSLPRWGRFVR